MSEIKEPSEIYNEYHSIKELCDNTNFSYQWVMKCIWTGRIKAFKTYNNRWQIPDDEYQMLIKNRKVPPQPPKKMPLVNKIYVPDHISDKILGRTRENKPVEEPEKRNEPAPEPKKRNPYWILPFKP